MIRKQYTIYLENRPGALALISRKLAKAAVNIESISAYTSADVGLVQLVASNAKKARKVLIDAKIAFTVQDVSLLGLPNTPGALAEVAEKLAKSGVNINYIYATGCESKNCGECHIIISSPELNKVEEVWAKK